MAHPGQTCELVAINWLADKTVVPLLHSFCIRMEANDYTDCAWGQLESIDRSTPPVVLGRYLSLYRRSNLAHLWRACVLNGALWKPARRRLKYRVLASAVDCVGSCRLRLCRNSATFLDLLHFHSFDRQCTHRFRRTTAGCYRILKVWCATIETDIFRVLTYLIFAVFGVQFCRP